MKKQANIFIVLLGLMGSTPLATPLVYAQNVQVFNGDDINFGLWLPGDGGQTSNQFFCVFKSSGDRRWDVVTVGSGAGGAFELTDGGGNTLVPQWVRIRNRTITANVSENFGQADNAGAADCTEAGGDNQRFRIRFTNAVLGSTPPGTYTGTVTLTVTPP